MNCVLIEKKVTFPLISSPRCSCCCCSEFCFFMHVQERGRRESEAGGEREREWGREGEAAKVWSMFAQLEVCLHSLK